jgi:hypothetical protein
LEHLAFLLVSSPSRVLSRRDGTFGHVATGPLALSWQHSLGYKRVNEECESMGLSHQSHLQKHGQRATKRLAAATATAATFGLLAIGAAQPASADTTVATVTVTGGSLSISAPANAGNLGTRANTVTDGSISGSLGQVQVLDARSAAAGSGWVASVISSAFTPPAGPAIAASAVSYTAGTITKVGTAVYTANDPGNLTGVSPAVTATAITGDNSATWNPTISVLVPGGTAAGVYSATITHSVV